MQYLLLIYIDDALLAELPEAEYDQLMCHCLEHAADLQRQGVLLSASKLEAPSSARALRVRDGRPPRVTDGPFAETKEVLAGFNLIEAADIDEATRIAGGFPWARFGCIEVRPVADMQAERRRVGAAAAPTLA